VHAKRERQSDLSDIVKRILVYIVRAELLSYLGIYPGMFSIIHIPTFFWMDFNPFQFHLLVLLNASITYKEVRT
jgi:hypothetical protein